MVLLGSFGWGGAERQGLLIAEGLRDRHGARVQVAALGAPDGAVLDRCRAVGLAVHALARPESRYAWLCGWKLRRIAAELVGRTGPACILAFTAPANLVAGVAAARHGVTAIWGQRDEGIFRFPQALERRSLASSACAVANGPGARDAVIGMGMPPSKVTLIPNGICLAPPVQGRTAWREALQLPEAVPAVVMVANLTRAKDHLTLIAGWQRIERMHPTAQLLLAGRPGDNEQAITEAIGRMHLGRIRLLGAVSDISGLLQAADLAVLSSRSEGQPNAVLEAMAAGLPVVATDNPGCRSALPGGPLVPPGDADALAEAILRLLDDPQRRRVLGQANAQRVGREFSTETAIDAYAAVVARSLAG